MSDKLKCPICETYFDARDEDESDDYDNIEIHGKCITCFENYWLNYKQNEK